MGFRDRPIDSGRARATAVKRIKDGDGVEYYVQNSFRHNPPVIPKKAILPRTLHALSIGYDHLIEAVKDARNISNEGTPMESLQANLLVVKAAQLVAKAGCDAMKSGLVPFDEISATAEHDAQRWLELAEIAVGQR